MSKKDGLLPRLVKAVSKINLQSCKELGIHLRRCIFCSKLIYAYFQKHHPNMIGQIALQPIEIIIANPEWYDWAENHKDQPQPSNAHLLTCGKFTGTALALRPSESLGDGWDGHLVVTVAKQVILDANIGQFSRPKKGLVLPDYAVLPVIDPNVFCRYTYNNKVLMSLRFVEDDSYLQLNAFKEQIPWNVMDELEFKMRQFEKD